MSGGAEKFASRTGHLSTGAATLPDMPPYVPGRKEAQRQWYRDRIQKKLDEARVIKAAHTVEVTGTPIAGPPTTDLSLWLLAQWREKVRP